MKKLFFPADIYLPDLEGEKGTKWACVACDQYTSEREYWREARAYVDGTPSTLDMMLPEAYLDREAEAIPAINARMREYLENGTLVCHPNSMIYLERVQSDGKVRRGIVGAVDLEEYNYNKGSVTITRATEGTVLERIPPRVAIRRGAAIEMPHIMILIDDKERSVVEPLAAKSESYKKAYDFDLMANSGHVTGYYVDESDFDKINEALRALCADGVMKEKYGVDAPALLFAIGDGNHSLASAKALYEEIKAEIGAEAAEDHPARYALCEVVNIHDPALKFEPIYRVMFGVDPEDVLTQLRKYAEALSGVGDAQKLTYSYGREVKRGEIAFEHPTQQLTVGTLQVFIDEYVKTHAGASVDYIHGEASVASLCASDDAIGFVFDGMAKNELFKTVIFDGALPRKTFSMGHAEDKRYYLECRKIVE